MSRTSRPTLRVLAVATGAAVALAPLALVAAPANAITAAPKTCKTGALPANVKGKPAGFKSGLPAGAWVWHDSKGFHLRVTHDSKSKLVFTGAVASSGKISAKRVYAEKGDVLWRASNHKAVKFTFRNYGKLDGIDFKVGCAKTVKITVNVKSSTGKATKLATTQIHLGKANANPATNGFAITRG